MEVAAPANSPAAPHPDVGAHERLLVRVAAEANCGALAHGAVHAVRGGCSLLATVTVTPSASSRRSVATWGERSPPATRASPPMILVGRGHDGVVQTNRHGSPPVV